MSDETKDAVDTFMRNWNEFQATNDERLKKMEKGLGGVAELDSKLAKIEKSFDALETQKQASAREEKTQKVIDEVMASMKAMETALNRSNLGADASESEMKRVDEAYAR